LKEADMDIAFIEKPYVYHNNVTEVSQKYRINASGHKRKRAAGH
jgi:hypothetical protein